MNIIFGDEEALLVNSKYAPFKAAFVVVENSEGFMLCENSYRHLWEITGGMIDPGEKPRACVVRECFEETNQTIEELRFVGIAEVDGFGYVPYYYTYINQTAEFEPNSEITGLYWWDINAVAKIGPICEVSREMILSVTHNRVEERMA